MFIDAFFVMAAINVMQERLRHDGEMDRLERQIDETDRLIREMKRAGSIEAEARWVPDACLRIGTVS